MKTCVTCIHYRPNPVDETRAEIGLCALSVATCLVTGIHRLRFCQVVREDRNDCGPEGALHEPKEGA